MQYGYAATSVKQIAEASGCTPAALYYHFRGGKTDILQAVMRSHLPDLENVLDDIREAESLYDVIALFCRSMHTRADEMLARLRWLMIEFSSMDEPERTVFYEKHLTLHRGLSVAMRPYLPDTADADWRAWMLIYLTLGYGHLFMTMEMRTYQPLSVDELIHRAAQLFSQTDDSTHT